jgi:type II secretory pathway pseudopilin PulG
MATKGTMERQARSKRARDERGAVLVLALFMLLVMSLLVATLLTFITTGLRSVRGLAVDRSTEYAASGAVQLAIQEVRYNSNPYFPSPGVCSPGPSGIVTIGSAQTVVYCTGTAVNKYSPSGSTRSITFEACAGGESMAQCTNPLVTAQVVFDDYSSTDQYDCTTSGTTTCGTGMTVKNWFVL